MIDKHTIDKIMDSVEIVDIVGDFVELKRKGVNYTSCCPFHSEKTPSFIVSPAKGIYKCFGCGKAGNSVNFIMEHEKLSYPESLRWLAKKYNIKVEERELTEEQKQQNDDRESMLIVTSWATDYFKSQLSTTTGESIAKSYFYERGFTDATIDKFDLGYCPSFGDMSKAALKQGYKEAFLLSTGLSAKSDHQNYLYDKFKDRVIFPISSVSGRVIGFGGRTMRTDKKIAKYLNSPQSEIYDKSKTLYGISQAKKAIVAHSKCILVEGYTDVIQMHQSGIENVVASSGTSLTTEQVKLIKRFASSVTVIYDGDSAGIKASLRGIDIILKEGLSVRVVPLPDGDDPDTFARKHNATQLQEYIDTHEEDFISFKTRILLDEQTKKDPIKRSEVITSIIKSISVIPDAVQRSIYISDCATNLDIDKEVLQNEIRLKIATSQDGIQGAEVERNRVKRERFDNKQTSGSEPPSHFFDEPAFSEQDNITTLNNYNSNDLENISQQIQVMEREIVECLIKYGDKTFDYTTSTDEVFSLHVNQAIIDDLKADNITLENEPYAQIYQIYLEHYNEDRPLPANLFINNPNKKISTFIAHTILRFEEHQLSGIWLKHDIVELSESEQLSIIIPKLLTIYKSKLIERDIEVLCEEQKNESDLSAQQQILSSIMEKTQIKKELLAQYTRIF